MPEFFQRLTPRQSAQMMRDDEQAAHVGEETTDVLANPQRPADILDIGLTQAPTEKIENNHRHDPVHPARGQADTYTQLGG
ncbi:hypothetical protein [Streptomyces sp. NPDC056549]|uniref:hypothetical protein n=1 Tax=Streptomyces sp. NPDC056549 TaxID=3345864 RepID=UPI0036C3898D